MSNLNLNEEMHFSMHSDREAYNASTSIASESENTSFLPGEYNCVRINGRKVIGPPPDWSGKPPTIDSEIYVKRIPKDMSELNLLTLFQRFGQIYCIRLMVDFCDQNRGFGYVHYMHEADALKAMDVLRHYFVMPFYKLHVEKSYDKCRLLVSNVPNDWTVAAIRAELYDIFPEMSDVVVHMDEGNRSFAYVDFPSHDAAIRAKQQTSTGRFLLFNREVKVAWARHECPLSTLKDERTLHVRNIENAITIPHLYKLLATYIPLHAVRSLVKIRDFAFIEFETHQAAERVHQQMHGHRTMNKKLHISWTNLTQNGKSLNIIHKGDYDATLRMKCYANHWDPPIYLMGRIFADNMSQYVAVLLNSGPNHCVCFMQINVCCADIISRAAEVVVSLINYSGQLPTLNYVLIVGTDAYHIVGTITNLCSSTFAKASGIIDNTLTLFGSELQDLCMCAALLLDVPRSALAEQYQNVLQRKTIFNFMPEMIVNMRCFGCVDPAFRKKPNLNHNIRCDPLIMAICDVSTGHNWNGSGPVASVQLCLTHSVEQKYYSSANNTATSLVYYRKVPLMPVNFGSRSSVLSDTSFVFFGQPPLAFNALG